MTDIVAKTVELTNKDFDTVTNLMNVTLTEGQWYTVQTQNLIYMKIGDAIFPLENKEFSWKQGSMDVYFKPEGRGIVTILENT